MGPERNSNIFAISIMSKDRIGIIASISKKIVEIGGDIADIRQSVLCGYFTMILLVAFPHATKKEEIESKLSSVNNLYEEPLLISVKQVDVKINDSAVVPVENNYVLTVTGRDQIGFVASITCFCAENGINILDLSTTRKNELYIMILFVDISHSEGINKLRDSLTNLQNETGFEIVLQHYNIFQAVNEIDLPLI
jgi:glycine cleavage system transcriptional repressor